jgi:hypothetical protein
MFLACVGDRPSPAHQLRKRDPSEPFSETNWQWLAPINPGRDYMTKEDRRAYARQHNLKRRFGITIEEYDAMFARQDGLCAICLEPSTQVHRKSGKVRSLAVDHDHATGRVRSLLCTDCNTVLGLADDSPQRLRDMADYLERHTLVCEPVTA